LVSVYGYAKSGLPKRNSRNKTLRAVLIYYTGIIIVCRATTACVDRNLLI